MYLKKSIKGFFLISTATVISSVIGYLLRMLYARNLSTEEFGLFYSVFAFITMFDLIKSFGSHGIFEKYIPKYLVENKNRLIASIIRFYTATRLILALIISVVLLLFSKQISTYFFRDEKAIPLIFLLVGYFLLSSLINIAERIFIGFQRSKYYAILLLFRISTLFVFSLVFFKQDLGFLAPGIAYFATSIVSLPLIGIMLHRLIPKFFKYKYHLPFVKIKEFWKYGITTFVYVIGETIINRTDILMITYFRSLSEVAYYNIAYTTATILLFFSTAFSSIFFPLFSELVSKGEFKKLRDGLKLLHRYGICFMIPIAGIFVLFPEIIITTLFGEKFIAGIMSLRILSIAFLVYVLANVNTIVILALKKSKSIIYAFLSASIINIILNFILISKIGATGASLATLISFGTILILTLLLLKKEIKYSLPIKGGFKVLLASIAFIGIAVYLKKIIILSLYPKMIVIGTLSLFIYLLLIWVFKVIKPSEMLHFIKITLKR